MKANENKINEIKNIVFRKIIKEIDPFNSGIIDNDIIKRQKEIGYEQLTSEEKLLFLTNEYLNIIEDKNNKNNKLNQAIEEMYIKEIVNISNRNKIYNRENWTIEEIKDDFLTQRIWLYDEIFNAKNEDK